MKTKICLFLILTTFLCLLSCKKPKTSPKVEEKNEYKREEKTKELQAASLRLDSLNAAQGWKELKCGLWLSKNNDIAFKTRAGTEEGIDFTYFLAHFEDDKPLKSVIDTNTFRYLGSSFYKDKHHVYMEYGMVSGAKFWILEDADAKTFRILGDSYAKDKNRIYAERNKHWEGVDCQTFKT